MDYTPIADDVLSEIYHALRAPRRRYLIHFAGSRPSKTFTTRELASEITAVEEGVPPHRTSGEPYRNVYNALSQSHLPALAEAGIIIYHSNRQIVEPGPNLQVSYLLLGIDLAALSAFNLFGETCTTSGDSQHLNR